MVVRHHPIQSNGRHYMTNHLGIGERRNMVCSSAGRGEGVVIVGLVICFQGLIPSNMLIVNRDFSSAIS